MAKQDFRKDMNSMLEVFYKTKEEDIIKAIKEFNVPYSDDIWMICDSLEQDGYIQLLRDPPKLPIGHITGQGKIFFEQGGYRDTTSRLDKMIDWFKNHKYFSIIIFIGVIITSLWGLVSIVLEVLERINYNQ